MIVTLLPMLSSSNDTPPTVSGETICYRGVQYDLSPLQDGATISIDLPFIGQITRVNGVIELSLQYCYDSSTAEDDQPKDWDAYTFNVIDGQCPCPIIRKPIPALTTEGSDE